MVRRVIAMVLIGLLTTTGCTVSFNGDDKDPSGKETPHAAAPTDDNGVEVWDLRTPPSADDVGLRADKDYVGYETRKPRRVRFLLPEDHELTIDATLVVFDRVMHKDPADPTRPTGMDFRMAPMPLETAYKVMSTSLKAFGLGTEPVDTWRHGHREQADIRGRVQPADRGWRQHEDRLPDGRRGWRVRSRSTATARRSSSTTSTCTRSSAERGLQHRLGRPPHQLHRCIAAQARRCR